MYVEHGTLTGTLFPYCLVIHSVRAVMHDGGFVRGCIGAFSLQNCPFVC